MLELCIIGNNVNYIQLKIFFLKQQILVLTVNIDQLFAQVTHGVQGYGGVVYKRSALAIVVYFASDNAVGGIVINAGLLEKSL